MGEHVDYEIAQVLLFACRVSEDPRDIRVYNENTVRSPEFQTADLTLTFISTKRSSHI